MVDAGANVGYSTMLLASLWQERSIVVALEPDEGNMEVGLWWERVGEGGRVVEESCGGELWELSRRVVKESCEGKKGKSVFHNLPVPQTSPLCFYPPSTHLLP